MKRLSSATKIVSIIFIILILSSVFIAKPILNKFSATLKTIVDNQINKIEDSTGLVIHYDSLSPSILSTFSINEINISNVDKDSVLEIKKVKINYNLIELLKKDYQKAFQNILIDGVTVNINPILKLMNKNKSDGSNLNSKNEVAKNSKNTIEQDIFFNDEIRRMIPQNISIKNLFVHYENKIFGVDFLFTKIQLLHSFRNKNFTIQSDVNMSYKLLSSNQVGEGKLSLKGIIPEDIENTSIQISLSDVKYGNFGFKKLNLIMNYQNEKIIVNTIQTNVPLLLNLVYDFDSTDFEVNVKSNDFEPLSILNSLDKKVSIKGLSPLSINTDSFFKYNVKAKEIDYSLKGNISSNGKNLFVASNNFGQIDSTFDVHGDEKESNVKIDLDGNNYLFNIDLNVIFNNLLVSGFIDIQKFLLPSGNYLSTELFFDSQQKGFMIFSPQIFVDDLSLTALQIMVRPELSSYDFTFEVQDYSNVEDTEPSQILMNGSYLTDSKYIQTNVSLNRIHPDSILNYAAAILKKETGTKLSSIGSKLKPYMISSDMFLSTDFSSVSYSVPYILFANTKKENQIAMISLNGNEQSIQIDRLSLIYNKFNLEASGSIDRMIDSSDMFFQLNLNSGSVPYYLSGTIMPEIININGDYGFSSEIRINESSLVEGFVNFENLPFVYNKTSILASTRTDFSYSPLYGPDVRINRLEIEKAESNISDSPKLRLVGNISKYGAQFSSVSYTDLFSALEGDANLSLNINENIFEAANLNVNLQNPLSSESISVDAKFSNPDREKFSIQFLKQSLYMDAQIQINELSINRFAELKNNGNTITASAYIAGTLEHPSASLNLHKAQILLANDFAVVKGSVFLEDRDLSIDNLSVNYSRHQINDLSLKFSLDTMSGGAKATINTYLIRKSIIIPLELKVDNYLKKENSFLPSSVNVTLGVNNMSGTFMNKPITFDISFLYNQNKVTFFSSDNIGLYGVFDENKNIEAYIKNKDFLNVDINGHVDKNRTTLDVSNIKGDCTSILSYFNLDEFYVFEKGTLFGDIKFDGTLNNPSFTGDLYIDSPVARIPFLLKDKASVKRIDITMENNMLRVKENIYNIKNSPKVKLNCDVVFNKLKLAYIEGAVSSIPNETVNVNFKTKTFSVSGKTTFDLDYHYEMKVFTLKGKLFGENVNITSAITNLNKEDNENFTFEYPRIKVVTDLDVLLGTHAIVNFNPILRAVFVPNSALRLKIDQPSSVYQIDGNLALKSGDIMYLNRSFYIKEGNILFNSTEITNPLVTLIAETREKDDSGNLIRINLEVKNQYLQNLNPRFTSIPSMSENEIKNLLGQIAIADSNNIGDLIFAASDYAIQSTVVRSVENKLRDLLNFDIFSLRTNVLQNTLNIGMKGNTFGQNVSIGNFFDNSTVYIGKYFGSALYVDAMLHFTYETKSIISVPVSGKLIFQPELGLEIDSPYCNVRLNVAPDIEAMLNKQYVPFTSLTLSWKFSF